MEIMATSKNYGKKKVRITSGIFWTLMGKNPIMEKSDAGAACLSWTFFFSVILSVTIATREINCWFGGFLSHGSTPQIIQNYDHFSIETYGFGDPFEDTSIQIHPPCQVRWQRDHARSSPHGAHLAELEAAQQPGVKSYGKHVVSLQASTSQTNP